MGNTETTPLDCMTQPQDVGAQVYLSGGQNNRLTVFMCCYTVTVMDTQRSTTAFARPTTCSVHQSFLYDVDVPSIGNVLKTDCCIKHARQWAKRAFPRQHCNVRRHVEVKTKSLPTGSILRQFGLV